MPNFLCVLTNERYKTYQTGFSFCPLCHAPGVGLWGAGGAQGVKKNFFFKHGHVVHQINGDAQGWDFGALGVPRGSKKIFFQTWSCGTSNRRG